MSLIGHGSKLTVLGATSTAPTYTVNKDLDCLSIDFGSNKIDTVDSTSMLTTGTARTYNPGLEDEGDVTVKYNVNPGDSSQAALAASRGVLYDFKVTYPGAVRVVTFSGILASLDESIPDDKNATKTAKIKISGPKSVSESGSGGEGTSGAPVNE